jgi:uncharacterized membrane protein YoaK (UPF0700 family)
MSEEPLPDYAFFVLLALASGATDAFGYLHLGGTFTSVMTGNIVLFGVAAVGANGALVASTASAICGYLFGSGLGVRVAGESYERTPGRTVRLLLRVEFTLLLAYALAFQVSSWPSHGGVQAAMLGVAAVALGMQSSAVQSYQVSGLSTTFLTGTLTGVAIHLASGRPLRGVARSVVILSGLLCGAGSAAGLALASPHLAVFLPVAFVAVALAFGVRPRRARNQALAEIPQPSGADQTTVAEPARR